MVVYITCAEAAAVSCGTSHETSKKRCKYPTLVDVQKSHCAKLQSLIQDCIQLQHSRSARKHRISHHEAGRAHPEMRHSTSVHTNKNKTYLFLLRPIWWVQPLRNFDLFVLNTTEQRHNHLGEFIQTLYNNKELLISKLWRFHQFDQHQRIINQQTMGIQSNQKPV